MEIAAAEKTRIPKPRQFKNRSGRLTNHELACKERVLNLCWEFLEYAMQCKKIPNARKIEIAKTLCAKDMPDSISGGNIVINVIHPKSEVSGHPSISIQRDRTSLAEVS